MDAASSPWRLGTAATSMAVVPVPMIAVVAESVVGSFAFAVVAVAAYIGSSAVAAAVVAAAECAFAGFVGFGAAVAYNRSSVVAAAFAAAVGVAVCAWPTLVPEQPVPHSKWHALANQYSVPPASNPVQFPPPESVSRTKWPWPEHVWPVC